MRPPDGPATPGFDLNRCVAFDVEIYPGRCCVGFHGPNAEGVPTTRTVQGREELKKALEHLKERGRILVGYNSERFDVPVIRFILAGLDPYAPSQALIAGEDLPVPLAKLPAFPCDHVDVSARLRRAGHIPSLKTIAANLGRPQLAELPYEPGTILTDEQWAEVVRYNGVDLRHTWALLERYAAELQALATLSADVGQDLRSTPTPKVVETVFLRAFQAKNRGRSPIKPELPHEVLYRPVAGVREPRSSGAREWYGKVVNTPLPVVTRGATPKVEVPKGSFRIGGVQLTVGAGGIHSVDRPRLYRTTRKQQIVSVDVGSFYPSLIKEYGITPGSYGDVGSEMYRGLLVQRLAIKAEAKTAEDPAERQRLDDQANGLKLVLNSTFGKYGDPYSSLFDPAAMIAVTLSGQLMLIDLIEQLTKVKARVLSVNTDGLFLGVRPGDDRWRKVLARWERATAMTLEVDPLKRLLILATNRYATLDAKGKIKRKGDGLKGSLVPLSPPNELVVADAVANALLLDLPPERTVWDERDPVRFCRITRRTGKVLSGVILDEATREEAPLPKVARWFKEKDSTRKIVHRFANNRHTTPSQATSIGLAMDLTSGAIPKNLDRSWYIKRARKVIQSVPGYRHLNPRLLRGNPLAMTAAAAGLVPCPNRGKAQPIGSDASHPTYLYNWAKAETAGTYTGPEVGIIVVDVDDPIRFKLGLDKGNSPLLGNRWEELKGCLVSVRGEAAAEDVRRGLARGKLIFRFAADADHPLARMRVNHWTKTLGCEVFYGKGIPSVLGHHPDGNPYRLEGELTDLPAFLQERLTPRGSLIARPARKAKPSDPVEVSEEMREGLLATLAGLDPELGKTSIGWRTKDLADGRRIQVGRCPYEHESGTSDDGDLSAGYREDGTPFLRCLHASCEGSREVNAKLAAAFLYSAASGKRKRAANEADQPKDLGERPANLTAIAHAMCRDLEEKFVSLHVAPTGSGKTFAIVQTAIRRYRQGLATAIAVPTLRLAEEIFELLQKDAPDAFQADAIARVFGGGKQTINDDASGDADDEEEGDAENGVYPIHEGTLIAITTHAQLARRGFSKFMRGIWPKLAADDEDDNGHPAFALVIDEVGELLHSYRREYMLAHRTRAAGEPDGSGGLHLERSKCPKFTRSGNCGNCKFVGHGGYAKFNHYQIRELRRPAAIPFNSKGRRLAIPREPLKVEPTDLRLGPKIRVGHTTFAAPVLEAWGRPVGDNTRRTAPLYLYQATEDGKPPYESIPEILQHLLEFAGKPIVTWEHPVNEVGEPIRSDLLVDRINQKDKSWDEGIVFPMQVCEVPTLRFIDLASLEQMRRHAAKEKVGVLFTGATLGPDDEADLRSIWPRLVMRDHPYPDRKIKQVAIALPTGYRGAESLIGADGRLLTAPLEVFGRGLVFCAVRKTAEALYNIIAANQPTARLAAENYEQLTYRKTLHHEGELKTYVTYSRSVLGLGVNIKDVRHLAVDAAAFRALASFTPDQITPEEFARLRAEERLSLILQNAGRALRGEKGKTVVLFVLNADPDLIAAIQNSGAIREGAELPTVIATGPDLQILVDQAAQWLAADGGNWPISAPQKGGPKPGRPKGTASKSPETVFAAATAAIAEGINWREFCRKHHPSRVLNQDQLAELKARFATEKASDA